jgi:glycosyltransferase involved in cell wall biosynthesis
LPVISNVVGGELEKMIEENNLGITLKSIEPDSLKKAVEYCFENFGAEDYERIRNFALQNFDGERIYKNYANWIKNL